MREPAYRALAEALREQIAAGAFPPDQRLPTDAELGDSYGVSRHTVRQAFGELVGEGLVYRVPGRGSFAVASPRGRKYLRSLGSVDDLLALAVDTELEVVQPFRQAVDVAAASRLNLATDEVTVGIFRRLHDRKPFSLTTTFLPPDVASRIGNDKRVSVKGIRSRATIIGLLEELAAVPLGGAHQSISASVADADTADAIGCDLGDAVLVIDRIYYDVRGRFVELAISTFNVRRYSYRLELRRSIR